MNSPVNSSEQSGEQSGEQPTGAPEQSEQLAEQVAQVRAHREAARLGHLYTLSEAAEAAGVSRSRIRRLLDAEAFPNAVRAPGTASAPNARPWRIPRGDLLAAGMLLNSSPDSSEQSSEQFTDGPEQPVNSPNSPVNSPDLAVMAAELAAVRQRVDDLERLVRATEKRAETAELAMRLLGPGQTDAPAPPPEATGAPTQATEAKGGPAPSTSWWRRVFGGGEA